MKFKKLLFAALIPGVMACTKDEEPQPKEEVVITVQDISVTIDENPDQEQLLATIQAETNGGEFTFLLKSESETGAFTVNTSGQILVADATLFDFEKRTGLTAIIELISSGVTETMNLTVTLNNVIDPTITVEDFDVIIDENPTDGDVLGTIVATTDQGTIEFGLSENNPAGTLSLDASTGELTVTSASLYDFETNPTITGEVKVFVGDVFQIVNVTITLNDVDETTELAFDADSDGLIDVYNIDQLSAIRLDLDGNGQADDPADNSEYKNAFPGVVNATTGIYSGYELMKDLDFQDEADYVDVSLKITYTSGSGWSTVGTSTNASFTATFEGNGYVITNLFINRSGSLRQGFFGHISASAEVKNLGLESANITAKFSSGILVGSSEGIITRCFVTGQLTATRDRIGGLVGSNSGSISECYSKAEIESSGGNYVGSIVGFDSGTGQSISNSYATGSVSGKIPIGGLVGGNNSSLVNCYSLGQVTASNSSSTQVGGLTGYDTGSSTDSYWNTETSGQATSAKGIGKTSSELQSPTSNTGIYVNWNSNVWDFGTASQYPVLKMVAGGIAAQR